MAFLLGVGAQWYAGDNCMLGKDYTVFSTVEGIVIFDKKREKPEVRHDQILLRALLPRLEFAAVSAYALYLSFAACCFVERFKRRRWNVESQYGGAFDLMQVHVYPVDHRKAVDAVTATYTMRSPDGQQSRKERRRAIYTPRKSSAGSPKKATLAVAQVAAKVTP